MELKKCFLCSENYFVESSLEIGGGCSTVGSSDASDTTDPRFVSSHWQFLFTVNFFKKTKIKKKEAENCPIFLNQVLQSTHQNLVV